VLLASVRGCNAAALPHAAHAILNWAIRQPDDAERTAA
jgi:hypothetical protein